MHFANEMRGSQFMLVAFGLFYFTQEITEITEIRFAQPFCLFSTITYQFLQLIVNNNLCINVLNIFVYLPVRKNENL